MKALVEIAIKILLSKLVHVSGDQWQAAVNNVIHAFKLPKSQRRAFVFDNLVKLFGGKTSDSVINFVIELAVSYAKKFLLKNA